MDNPNRNENLSWLDKDVERFKKTGRLIPAEQTKIYSKIRDHFVGGRTVIDIGSSIGVGSNILSHTARAVWAVDVNEQNIRFGQNIFSRPNLTFELLDIEALPTRPLAQFEIVVMSEVIEHLSDVEAGLAGVKRFFSDKLQTIGFITAPNISHERVGPADAHNELHVNHWTPGEFYALMTKHFRNVTLFSSYKLDQWVQEETTDGNDTTSRIIVAKVEGAING